MKKDGSNEPSFNLLFIINNNDKAQQPCRE